MSGRPNRELRQTKLGQSGLAQTGRPSPARPGLATLGQAGPDPPGIVSPRRPGLPAANPMAYSMLFFKEIKPAHYFSLEKGIE